MIANYFDKTYHWKDKKKLEKDVEYLRNLYEVNLIYLSNKLNLFHKTSYSIKYWRIIVGPWLKFFIDIIFDRYESLRLSKRGGFLECNIRFGENIEYLRSIDFSDFYYSAQNDEWNEILFNLLTENSFSYSRKHNIKFFKNKKKLTSKIINIFRRFSNNNILISDIYISKKNIIKLIIHTGLIPYMNEGFKISNDKNWFKFIAESSVQDKSYESNFENLLKECINIYLPYIYTDGFQNFKNKTLSTIKHLPKVIFTCIGYQHNEAFKLIAAETVSNGGKLIISQHGGNFGLAKHNQMEEHQISISDKFLTWGWGKKLNKKVKPFFSIQLSTQKKLIPSQNKKIINVLASSPRYFYSLFSLALGPEYKYYLEKQKSLDKKLKDSFEYDVYHRLNGDNYGWEAEAYLNNFGLKRSDSEKQLNEDLSNYSLCISSYNATVGLHTLALNFPTILYWPKDIFEIRLVALKDLDELASVGIFHDNLDSLVNHFKNISGDISSWWDNKNTQIKRISFCKKYANTSFDWINNLKQELCV